MPPIQYPRQPNKMMIARQRQSEALKLRQRGLTYQQISEELQYSGPGAAKAAVERGLENLRLAP